ncbi:MAG: hypothetical protein J4A00_07185 [Gammaproteobacteria bacterium]|nr:hypothetical protein [Gammaproteobacteria bacterium]
MSKPRKKPDATKPQPRKSKGPAEPTPTTKTQLTPTDTPDQKKPGLGEIHLNPPAVCKVPTTEEMNEYRSAATFIQALAEEAQEWHRQLPENYKPAVSAVLYGGVQVAVHTMSQVSFHGIRIEGLLNGNPCSLFAHQSTIQVLCYGEEESVEQPRRPIGFVWENNSIQV